MKQLIIYSIISIILALSFNFRVYAGVVDSELEAQLQAIAPDQMVSIIVTLKTRADTNIFKDKDKTQRRKKIVRAMRDHANLKHPPLLKYLKASGATAIRPLWIINSVAAKVPAHIIRNLAKRPGVARVYMDATLSLPGSSAASFAPPEWNLSAIHASDVWNLGHTAQGVVVANMDTGVDGVHPDLASRWRGGANSWYDPHGQFSTPTDYAGAVSGHGTQTMGLIVAGDSGGSTIGVAPNAKWIAVKTFNNLGTANESHFHQSFQWLLDPDNNPLTDDAPDVVNGSFQTASAGICDTRFQADIQALKTAGISVVFAAGNGGPNSSTSSSPANNSGSFAAGAVDSSSNIASFSARGPTPSACGGQIFPNLVAPGKNVYTTDLTFAGMAFYAYVNGTSFAAPHIAGGMALLMGAFPNVSVAALETALQDSATDLGMPGPDNEYGYGMLNVLGAYNILANSSGNPVGIEDSYIIDQNTTLTVLAPGVLSNDTDPQNDTLTALLNTDVSHGSLVLNIDGSFSYTPANNYNGIDSFTYKASDGTHESGIVTVMITINPVSTNAAPVAVNDSFEGFEDQLISGNVLTNDSDTSIPAQTLTAQLVSGPIGFVLNSDGSFSYTPTANFNGQLNFTYQANDGQSTNNLSNVATGTLTIAAVNDAPNVISTPPTLATEDTLYSYIVVGSDVDTNDTAPQSLSYSLITAPAGMTINSGVISWIPTNAQVGIAPVTVRVTDSAIPALTADQSFDINVANVNDAPTLNSIASPQSAVAGTAFSLTAVGSDIDAGDTLTYSLSGHPAWLSINPSTGVLSGTPTSIGSFSVIVTVTDTTGASASQAFTLNVNAAPVSSTIYFSTLGNTNPAGLGGTADNADIYAWNGSTFSRVANVSNTTGAETGVIANPIAAATTANVDELKVISLKPLRFYVSFAETNVALPGIGSVQDEDIVYYNNGVWSVFFNGTDPDNNARTVNGLTSDSQDIDAFDILGTTIYFSTQGNTNPYGVAGTADDADIYAWNGASFSRVVDMSTKGVPAGANIDGLKFINATHFYLSFTDNTTLPGLGTVQDEDIVYYNNGLWSVYFDGTPGLGASGNQDIDGFDIIPLP